MAGSKKLCASLRTMKQNTIAYFSILLLCLTWTNCSSDKTTDVKTVLLAKTKTNDHTADSTTSIVPNTKFKTDSVILSVSKDEDDVPINDYRTSELKPIRGNYRKLNSINEWEAVNKRKIEDRDGNGAAEYYFLDGQIKKIIVRYLSKREISEFYLMNGELSMVIFKSISTDDELEELVTDKNYLRNNKLLHKINSQDCGSPFSDEYINTEQKRILDLYSIIAARRTE